MPQHLQWILFLAYQFIRDKAIDVFAKYRSPLEDIESGYMRTCVYDAYRITANRYTSDELMANRAKFENEVRVLIDSTLTKEGFWYLSLHLKLLHQNHYDA